MDGYTVTRVRWSDAHPCGAHGSESRGQRIQCRDAVARYRRYGAGGRSCAAVNRVASGRPG